MSDTAFPLEWPQQFPRTKHREAGRFNTHFSVALGNVHNALYRFAKDSGKEIDNLRVSCNVTPSIRRPDDPGIAIWFLWEGMQVCLPIDRYTLVSQNLQSAYHVIQARRAEIRHGSLELVRCSFKGYLLATAPGEEWWRVLGVSKRASTEEIKKAYHRLASENHPDKGGNDDMMAKINNAFQEAQYQ